MAFKDYGFQHSLDAAIANDKVIALKAKGASCGSCRYHAAVGNGVNSYEICIIKENKRIMSYNICCHHKSSMNK